MRTFRMRWWKAVLVLGAVGGVVTLLAYGFTTDPRAIPSILTGKPAPDFSLTLFDGRTVRLSDFRGKVVFLGVDIQDTEEAARRFIQEFGITYMNGRDPKNRIAIDYGVYGIPETFFIDRDGQITYKHIGALGWEAILVH